MTYHARIMNVRPAESVPGSALQTEAERIRHACAEIANEADAACEHTAAAIRALK